MNIVKDILDRIYGVRAANQKLEFVIRQSEKLMETVINHESRISRLETLQEIKTPKNSRTLT